LGSVWALSAYFDVFDQFAVFVTRHEVWGFEELVAALFFLGFAVMIFALRRLSDLRDLAQRAQQLAREDELTGLPNRRRFLEELDTWQSGLEEGQGCVLFLIDLDQFKPVNDLYGHRLGDEVLRTTARRLKNISGDRAFVARIGGDEFGILMPVVSDHEAPRRLAERIIDEIPQPVRLAALAVKVGVSIGMAFCKRSIRTTVLTEQDGSESETVLRQADMALYQAKALGRSGYHFFCPSMDEELRSRVDLEREIDGAIKSGQIVPFYQPLIDLKSGEIVGLEALVRWQHPTRGLLPPAIIIPVAESTGTISDLTFSILRQAIVDAKTWPNDLSIAVNFSPQIFADAWLAEKILQLLTELSFPPRRLELEITETAVLKNIDETKVVIDSLRNLGVQMAIDDFGAGYSGLAYLQQFKLDRIKIDKSFVTDLPINRDSRKIVQAIVSFSHALGLKTTAEGIETVEVLSLLRELGCDTGQGYFFCKPKPASEIHRYLVTTRARRSESAAVA